MRRLRVQLALRTRLRRLRFSLRWGFTLPPPLSSDIEEYECLLESLQRHNIAAIQGDVVEIGTLFGACTYTLCKFFERAAPTKRVFAVDVFDLNFDVSRFEGKTWASLYHELLYHHNRLHHNGLQRDQRSIYNEVTRPCTNLITVASDSRKLKPPDRIAYAHIDGNHDPEYVRSDFELLWPNLSPGGIVSFDDYDNALALPHVTRTVDALIQEHNEEIEQTWTAGLRTIFIKKR